MDTVVREGDLPGFEPAELSPPDRGMQILEYFVAGLAVFAAAILTFVR